MMRGEIKFYALINVFVLLLLTTPAVLSDEMRHKFKSPSFSGQGASSHYLTIENQTFNRKEAIDARLEALADELEREAQNTTLARFQRNLESRIYAQLSRQLVDNLFGENKSTEGIIELLGNKIEYESDGETVTLTITDEDGGTTTIVIPVNSFTF
tara:strand:+ start:697 stop:1164 length:468 start_codon:yes stop_codon:yes gene_type:complete